MEKIQETFNKELEALRKNDVQHLRIKNALEGIKSRITEIEEWICELEDRMVEITSIEQNKGKISLQTKQMRAV